MATHRCKQLTQSCSGHYASDTRILGLDGMVRGHWLSALPPGTAACTPAKTDAFIPPVAHDTLTSARFRHTEQGATEAALSPFLLLDLELGRQKCQSINSSWLQTFPLTAGAHVLLKNTTTCCQMGSTTYEVCNEGQVISSV